MRPGRELPRIWIQSYYPSFNGLRGVAASLVLFAHLGHFLAPTLNWTALFWGNDLFFVLSGFLITGILFDSRLQPKYFSTFYKRRSLRIFPLYYGFFLVILLASRFLPLHWDISMFSFVVYMGNLVTPWIKEASHNPTVIGFVHNGTSHPFIDLGPLWSLCVEEQFYLGWPLVIYLVRDRRKLLWVCGITAICTLGLRLWIAIVFGKSVSPYLLYWSTYTRWDTLLFGAWLALWLRGRALTVTRLRLIGGTCMMLGTLALLGPLNFRLAAIRLDSRFTQTFGLTALALLCTGIVLLSLNPRSILSRCFLLPPLAFVGRISYGIYFFHALTLPALNLIAQRHPGSSPYLFAADVVASVLVAKLSFDHWESRFLALKDKWAPQQPKAHPHLPQPQPALVAFGIPGDHEGDPGFKPA